MSLGVEVSALDRLIWDDARTNLQSSVQGSSAAGYQGAGQVTVEHAYAGDILILDDVTGALTRLALEETVGRVLVRNRSYTDTLALWNSPDLRQYLGSGRKEARLILAGIAVQMQNGIAGEYDATSTGKTGNKPAITPDTFPLHAFLTRHNFTGALAIGRLPKSHGALDDVATDLAVYSNMRGEDVTLILGGNTKHMTRAFNDTLARSFEQVHGLRGRGKFRCLTSSRPRVAHADSQVSNPVAGKASPTERNPNTPYELVAFGGVFAGNKADRGGQLLAGAAVDLVSNWQKKGNGHLPEPNSGLTVVDLGCGNGSVTADLLRGMQPGVINTVHATDVDMDAVRSASVNLGLAKDTVVSANLGVFINLTTSANFTAYPKITVTWDDAGSYIPSACADLVLLNPPFHTGTTVDLTLVGPLLDAAKRILKPGGTLLLVHNSHARYRPQVQQRFPVVTQVLRDSTFTVLRAELA